MTFGITAGTPNAPGFATAAPTPSSPAFGLVAAISAAPGFALNATTPTPPGFSTTGELLAPVRDSFNEFIQWRFGGVDLGAPTVRVIDFEGPADVLEVTRGVGDNKHVLTVRVTRQFLYFTSWLFPIDVEPAEIDFSTYPLFGSLIVWPIESVDVTSTIPLFGTLTLALNQYTFQLPEAVDVVSTIPMLGTLDIILVSYTFQLAEQVDVTSTIPLSGTLV